MQRITVLFSEDTRLLNSLTEVAHTLVSTLGKIFNTTFFPAKSERETSFKSLPVSTNAGALELTEGRSSTVLAGLGPSLV